MTEETIEGPGGWLDARSLMDQAERENAAELAEHGSHQPTLADAAELAYEHFKIGMWHLGQDNPAEALRWLRTAVAHGVVEAEPLLRLCQRAAEPAGAGRDAHDDELETETVERHTTTTAAAATDAGRGDDRTTPHRDTPIYDEVADGYTVSADGTRTMFTAKFRTGGGTPLPPLRRWDLAHTAAVASALQHLAVPLDDERNLDTWTDYVSCRLVQDLGLVTGQAEGFPAVLSERLMLTSHARVLAPCRFEDLEGDVGRHSLRAFSGDLHGMLDRLPIALVLAHASSRDWLSRWPAHTASGFLLPSCKDIGDLDALEHRVAVLAARGMSGRAIARALGISYADAQKHYVRACRKLGVAGREGLRAALAAASRDVCEPQSEVGESCAV